MVHLYVGFRNSAVGRPVELLRDFGHFTLKPSEEKEVIISCPVEKLCYYNEKTGKMELEHMDYEVYIGTSSCGSDLLEGKIRL